MIGLQMRHWFEPKLLYAKWLVVSIMKMILQLVIWTLRFLHENLMSFIETTLRLVIVALRFIHKNLLWFVIGAIVIAFVTAVAYLLWLAISYIVGIVQLASASVEKWPSWIFVALPLWSLFCVWRAYKWKYGAHTTQTTQTSVQASQPATTTVKASSRINPLWSFVWKTTALILSLVVTWYSVIYLVGLIEYYKKDITGSSPNPSIAQKSNGILNRAQVQDVVYTFWNKHLPMGDARTMINIAQAESKFEHWDNSGNVTTNTNDDGSIDICVMQINSVWWEDAEKLGYNLKNLDGCLQMALYIFKKEGPEEWSTYEGAVETSDKGEFIVAPTFPEKSPVQKVKANCHWYNDVPLDIWDDKGVAHRKNPGETKNVFTWKFQISVPEGSPPGNMRYVCK